MPHSPPRNRLIRARLLAALADHGRMDAVGIAVVVYGRRRRSPTAAQLASTHRALRRLLGLKKIVLAGRCRRRRLFALPADPLLSDLVVEFHD